MMELHALDFFHQNVKKYSYYFSIIFIIKYKYCAHYYVTIKFNFILHKLNLKKKIFKRIKLHF